MRFDWPKRIKKLQDLVMKRNIEAFVVTDQESIYYLTGASYKPLERPFFIIIWPDKAPTLIVPELEREHMKKVDFLDDVKSYWEYPSKTGEGWMDVLLSTLEGINTIGVEPTIKAEITQQLENKKVEVMSLIQELRLIKSNAEILEIRYASKYADLGMALMCANLYNGVTPLEQFSISKKIQKQVIMSGQYEPLESEFLTACWPAPYSAQPHSIPPLGVMARKGPTVLMSFLRINGYAAECERTVFVSQPAEEEREIFQHMLNARQEAFKILKPGVKCEEIDYAAREYLAKNNLDKYTLHRTGHGIGMGNHEGPWVGMGSKDKLQKNMVISIEPGIYIPKMGGFRHSDTVLITANGYELLTEYPTNIDELIFKETKPLKQLKGAIMKKVLKI